MEKSHFPELINSERIILKKHHLDIAPIMFDYVDKDRERLRQFLPWVDFIKSAQDEINYVNRTHSDWEKYHLYDYGIFDRATGTYMGNVGVHNIQWGNKCCEIGFWILGDFEGKGIMSEAVKALEQAAFEKGFHRVEIRCSSLNQRSASVPRRLGYQLEGVLSQDAIERGCYRDTMIFGKLKQSTNKSAQPLLLINPIGVVHSSRKEIADDNWNQETAFIELNSEYSAESLKGLEQFSHAEILFYMNKVESHKIETAARRPRNNPHWPEVGIFAQRGKNRPNQMGLTVCEILKIEGRKVHLKNLDAIDGTPIIDIKPWMKEFAPQGTTRQPLWSSELMQNYWKASKPSTEPSMFDPIIIDTEHVKIRPLSTVTWQKLAEGLLYEGSFHATSWGIKTPEDIKKMYESGLAAWQSQKGNPIVFLNKEETEVVGMTNFMNVEPANKMIEIGGTWIHKKWQRSFVNTETKFALLQYCFETLKMNRVEFRIDSENFPSQKAVQRLGFHFDGLMPRRKINANNDIRDYVFYSVTDQTWLQVKSHIQYLMHKSKLEEFTEIQKIRSFLKAGDANAAFDSAQSALKKFSQSPELHYLAANICDGYRTETEAVSFYVKALELGLKNQDRRNALLGLASTYRSLGQYENAKKTFEMGIKDFPNYRPYYVFLALTEFNLNHTESAMKLLLDQIMETTSDQEIRSYEKALKFYSTRLREVFD